LRGQYGNFGACATVPWAGAKSNLTQPYVSRNTDAVLCGRDTAFGFACWHVDPPAHETAAARQRMVRRQIFFEMPTK
jgi:hypothetical protein